LAARLADVASWLGRVAQADGRLADALGHYQRMATIMESLTAREPAVVKWQSRSADAYSHTGTLLAISGRLSEALALHRQAASIFAALAKQDPANRQWRLNYINSQLLLLALDLDYSPASVSGQALLKLIGDLDALAAVEPASRPIAERLFSAWRLLAQLRHAQKLAGADEASARALAIIEPRVAEQDVDLRTLCIVAQAHVLAGRIERSRERLPEAIHHWRRVIKLLDQHRDSRDWRVLDPLAQACVLLDDVNSARPLIDRLREAGYRPIDALSATTLNLAQ
jgi:tetratricopeptide (TPR) repeat protein